MSSDIGGKMKTEITARPEIKKISEAEIKHILKPGEVGAILELVVKDKDGKVTEERIIKSKSFVRQFLELLWIQTIQIPYTSGGYSLKDTSNTLRLIAGSAYTFAVNAEVADTAFGIVIGTGSGAPTINDYHLGAIIAHATMNYGAVTFGLPTSDSTTSQFTITRNFSNVSGGSVTVQEIGLYVRGFIWNSTYYFMAIRDVTGGIVIPNGQTLTVNYRIQAVI